jgi:hypothetical protein
MPFTIAPSTNPHTRGRGGCFTYGIKPAMTVALLGRVELRDCADTDEGCYLSLANAGAEVIVVLPMSLATLLNSISSIVEFNDR